MLKPQLRLTGCLPYVRSSAKALYVLCCLTLTTTLRCRVADMLALPFSLQWTLSHPESPFMKDLLAQLAHPSVVSLFRGHFNSQELPCPRSHLFPGQSIPNSWSIQVYKGHPSSRATSGAPRGCHGTSIVAWLFLLSSHPSPLTHRAPLNKHHTS